MSPEVGFAQRCSSIEIRIADSSIKHSSSREPGVAPGLSLREYVESQLGRFSTSVQQPNSNRADRVPSGQDTTLRDGAYSDQAPTHSGTRSTYSSLPPKRSLARVLPAPFR